MISPRHRLRVLRAIPDQNRTDEQWDELNELEIMLAPVNRIAPLPDGERTASEQGRVRGARSNSARTSGARSTTGRASGARPGNSRANSARPNGNAATPVPGKKSQGARGQGGEAQTTASVGAPGGAPAPSSALRRKPAKRPRRKPRSAGPVEGG